MPHLVVSSLELLAQTAMLHKASHMVTLINQTTVVERPSTVAESNHLFLGFNDIIEPVEGMTPPSVDHVHKLIAFAGNWDRRAPMVVHCFAGISRSTAAAYITALAVNPALDEARLAQELRRRAPSATPNLWLIRLADDILERGGKMVRSIESIGRGANAYSGTPFVLPLEL